MSSSLRRLMAGATAAAPAGSYYIDTANPLSDGLLLCMLPGTRENLVYPVGDARRTAGTFMFGTSVNANGTSMDTTGAQVNTTNKMGLRVNPAANGPIVGGLTNFSIFVCATNLGPLAASPGSSDSNTDNGEMGAGNALYAERGDADSGRCICKLGFGYIDYATQLEFTYRNSNGNLLQLRCRADGLGNPQDPSHTFAAMATAAGSAHALYTYNPTGFDGNNVNAVNGKATATLGGSHSSDAGVVPMVGCDWWDNRAGWKGAIHVSMLYGRTLSDSEWAALKANPGQLIKKS